MRLIDLMDAKAALDVTRTSLIQELRSLNCNPVHVAGLLKAEELASEAFKAALTRYEQETPHEDHNGEGVSDDGRKDSEGDSGLEGKRVSA